LGFSIAAHFDKAETFRTPCIALHHDLGAAYSAVGCKGLLKIFVTEGIRQVAYVKFVAH
jgi:hypothetical protein